MFDLIKKALLSILLAGALLAPVNVAIGQGSPAQWAYSFVGNNAQATYPGQVTIPQLGTGNCVGVTTGFLSAGPCVLPQSAANTMLGNWTSALGNVTPNAMPSCADAGGNHLNYVAGTGVTCGTTGTLPSIAAYDTICNPTSSTAVPIACQNGVLHSKDMGAVGNNVADDTTALQNWINACQTNNLICFLDAGTYKTSSTLTCNAALTIQGVNSIASVIQPTLTTSGIICTTASTVVLRNFAVTYASNTGAAITAITITATGAAVLNTNSRIDQITVINAGVGIKLGQVTFAIIRSCYLNNISPGGAAILLDNTGVSNADTGDSTVEGCNLAIPNTATGILINSFAGLRIINNKIIGDGTASTGISLNEVNAAVNLSDLQIIGNSIEAKTTGIGLARQGASGTFTNVNISSNEIEASFCVTTDSGASTWLNQINVVGNVCQVAATGDGIIANTGTGWAANDNSFYGGASTAAIAIGANVVTGTFGPNAIDTTITTHITNSSTTAVLLDPQGEAFTSLPAIAGPGSSIFVTNGAPASSPCTGASTGSTAFRQNTAWKCF